MNHETSSYLMHHGVKGMKWGIRNAERRKYSPSGLKKDSGTLERRYNPLGTKRDPGISKRKSKSDHIKIDRKTRKQMRKDYSRYEDQETKKAHSKYKIDKQRESLRKTASNARTEREIANMFGYNGPTKSGKKVREGSKNLRESLDKANSEANKKATQRMVKKYGKKQVDSFNKSETRRGMAAVAAVTGVTAGVGFLTTFKSTRPKYPTTGFDHVLGKKRLY